MSAFATVLPVSDDRLEESLVEVVGKKIWFLDFPSNNLARQRLLRNNF